MIDSLILRTATRLLIPIMLLFSLQLLLEGHHAPGGGFAGGLVAAGAYALYAIAYGVREARDALPLHTITILGVGLAMALISGLVPIFNGRAFLEGVWAQLPMDAVFEVGTPLLFDLGVYFIVVGAVLTAVFELERLGTEGAAINEERPNP